MKKLLVGLLSLVALSSFAGEIGSVMNRQTKDKLIVQLDEDNKELEIILSKYGVEERINIIKYDSLADIQGIELTGAKYKMNIWQTTIDASSDTLLSYGNNTVEYFEWCLNPNTDNRKFCFFPIPGVLVVVPVLTVGMHVAAASTFLAGVLLSPVDGAITLSAKLLSKEGIAKSKFSKVMKGKTIKVTNKVFLQMVKELQTL